MVKKSYNCTSIPKKFVPNKTGYVGIAIEQSVHYCPYAGHRYSKQLSLIQTGSNVGTVQLPSLLGHFYLKQIFFGMRVLTTFFL